MKLDVLYVLAEFFFSFFSFFLLSSLINCGKMAKDIFLGFFAFILGAKALAF